MGNVKPLKVGKLVLIILIFFIPLINEDVLAAEDHKNVDFSKIDEYMRNELERLNIPGASISIVKDEKVQYIKGYGISGPNGKEMTPQTPVVLGSVSKSFTALAIMQLVDKEMIQLDNPVQQYIPWFTLADEKASKEITIRNLLNHTSGISEYDGQVAISQGNQSIKKLVESLRDIHISNGVNETYQYSNLNYSILGLVIEEVMKIPYAEYISSNIFKPLQMQNSFANPKEDKNNTLAVGYETIFGFKKPTELLNHEANIPHGYLISSAEDMSNYMLALLNKGKFKRESVLSNQSVNEMHKPSSFIGNDIYYAMGWEIDKDIITHNGWTENTYTRIILDGEYGITLLINSFDYFNSNQYDEIATNLFNYIEHNEPLILSEKNPNIIYIIFDSFIALAIAYMIFSIYKLFNQQKRKKTPFRTFLNVVTLSIINFLLPFLLLYFVTQVVPLSVATLFAPGIGHALFIIPLFLIIIGVINIGKLVLDKVSRNYKKLHSKYSS